ncbi:MAG TPA: TetR family transcriptional regulator [Candidatus Dormibacteraeota bacterium]|nr:TetR family transcriptional regulator [Candidatus Dormibacteraeota bacterium]
MSPDEERQQTLTRERLVAAALELINQEGLEGLSMRALADTLEVKAASLYWHVRDRRELIELLAESILERVPAPTVRRDWRQGVMAAATALRARVAAQRDADRILLEVPDALSRSDSYAELTKQLQAAGLQAAEASEVALMIMVPVIAGRTTAERQVLEAGSEATIAIDSGSRGVLLRPGMEMDGLIRAAHDRTSAAPAIVRGEKVVVRRLRGVGYGEIELNPRHPWRFQIQGATWNTLLEGGGLDVRAIKLDSGAAKVECFLPRPRGVVPIEVSGGTVGLTLHRPRGVAVAADISTGAVQLKLDDYSLRAAVTDVQWESDDGASSAPDRYQLSIKGGAFQVSLDSEAKAVESAETAKPIEPLAEQTSALEILLDGVESRVRDRVNRLSS